MDFTYFIETKDQKIKHKYFILNLLSHLFSTFSSPASAFLKNLYFFFISHLSPNHFIEVNVPKRKHRLFVQMAIFLRKKSFFFFMENKTSIYFFLPGPTIDSIVLLSCCLIFALACGVIILSNQLGLTI